MLDCDYDTHEHSQPAASATECIALSIPSQKDTRSLNGLAVPTLMSFFLSYTKSTRNSSGTWRSLGGNLLRSPWAQFAALGRQRDDPLQPLRGRRRKQKAPPRQSPLRFPSWSFPWNWRGHLRLFEIRLHHSRRLRSSGALDERHFDRLHEAVWDLNLSLKTHDKNTWHLRSNSFFFWNRHREHFLFFIFVKHFIAGSFANALKHRWHGGLRRSKTSRFSRHSHINFSWCRRLDRKGALWLRFRQIRQLAVWLRYIR